jgi:hypothetical protein
MKNFALAAVLLFLCACGGDKAGKPEENLASKKSPKIEEKEEVEVEVLEKTVEEPSEISEESSLDYLGSGCHKSNKVKALMNEKLKTYYADMEEEYYDPFYFIELSDSDLEGLSPLEKFVYATEFPAEISQVCAIMMGPHDPQKHLIRDLKFESSESYFSESQDSVVLAMNDESISLIKDCLPGMRTLSGRYKELFLKLDSYKLIPGIIKMYKNQEAGKKDNELLTILFLKMEDDEFPEFMDSGILDKFQTTEEYYPDAIVLTPALIEQIFELSRSYMLWRSLEV